MWTTPVPHRDGSRDRGEVGRARQDATAAGALFEPDLDDPGSEELVAFSFDAFSFVPADFSADFSVDFSLPDEPSEPDDSAFATVLPTPARLSVR